MLHGTVDFKKGRLFSVELTPGSPLEAESFLWLVIEEEGKVTPAGPEESKHPLGTALGATWQRTRGSLQKLRAVPRQWQAGK